MQFSNTITFLVAAICLIVASIVIGEHVKASRTPIDTTKFPGEARPDAWWLPLHETLVREAESTAHDVIFYGDSITEAWRGTSAGKHADRYQDNAKAFTHTFQPHLLGKKKKTLQVAAFGMAGDQTRHQLWRLVNGELPLSHPPKVAVFLIGTNNLGWSRLRAGGEDEAENIQSAVPVVGKHVLLMLHYIHHVAPNTKILFIGLLPRGGGSPDAAGFQQPSIYTPAIEEVNMHFEEYAQQDGRVSYVDCTAALLTNNGTELDRGKVPDGLHPMGPGAQALADCIHPALHAVLNA